MRNWKEAWMWKTTSGDRETGEKFKAEADSPSGRDVWAERPRAEREELKRERQKERRKEGGSNQGESRRFLCNTHRPQLSPSSTIFADWREGFVWRGGQDHQYLVKEKLCPEEWRGLTPSWGIQRGLTSVYMCEYVLCVREKPDGSLVRLQSLKRSGRQEEELDRGVYDGPIDPLLTYFLKPG